MSDLLQAVVDGASPEDMLATELPSSYRAAYLLKNEIGIFEGETDKDVRKSLHVGDFPMPEIAPDEVVVAVMSAAINFSR
jgi:crotonyl-CoA reductase